jgi:hypothetical protein
MYDECTQPMFKGVFTDAFLAQSFEALRDIKTYVSYLAPAWSGGKKAQKADMEMDYKEVM